MISPYLIRNYVQFNQVILVKSLGFNLWKGNNELSFVQGYEDLSNFKFKKLKSKINNLEKNKYYEINRDNIFLEEAKKNLSQDSTVYLSLFFKKIFSFYFIDLKSNYPNYYSFLNIFPSLIIALISFFGLISLIKKKNIKNNYLALYLFLNLIIFSIFFILPRYKLIILPIQIMAASYFILSLFKKKIN